MLLYVLGAFVAIVLILAIVIATRPTEFRVVRSITMKGPASAAFALVNDFHEWTKWSPWEKIDPALQRSYDGAASGVGAKYAWVGNSSVGQGNMTILESAPNSTIRIALVFLKPMAGTSTAEFSFKEDAGITTVTWTMDGTNNFFAKAFGLFMSMDTMIGGQFEQGLADMKAIVEAAPPQKAG
ncbi:MAG: SRPBCC family protein [Candidatus Hydrogenedentes bacterium]|nr:SRPBCC family protein [Candidatus Hydrogenedentota bacterium]